MTMKSVLVFGVVGAVSIGCQMAPTTGAGSPSTPSPPSNTGQSVSPECAREAQAAEHPSNAIEEREGHAHLKSCMRHLAEKKAESDQRGREATEKSAEEANTNAHRAESAIGIRWVRTWRTRCEEDLSTAVCREAPKGTAPTHLQNCGKGPACGGMTGRGYRTERDLTPIGERRRGATDVADGLEDAAVCGEDCASIQDCESTCGRMVEAKLSALVASALTACLTRYVGAKGKGTFACDVATPKVATADVTTRIESCSKACAQQGPEAIVTARESDLAEKQAENLSLAYRRCMVAADSTPLARKYQAYDQALYDELISKASATCRKANRCDWLEKYSKTACDYSP